MAAKKQDIIAKLRQDIITWEGFRPIQPGALSNFGLGQLENAFPNQVFPTGAIHEFLSTKPEETSACGGMISGLVGKLLQQGGVCIWVSYTRRIYPPALKLFGVDSDRVIFVDVPRQKDVLWVTEEALKCEGVTAVICETHNFSLMESRRLQLAVEHSQVTGFVLRKDVKAITTTACVARWKVKPVRSKLRPGMPGVGHPRWNVELQRVKNGRTGHWTFEWRNRNFHEVIDQQQLPDLRQYA
ncbi:MAG: Error-prone repair protein ImuA [Bacteroidetes bacterium]|nr:Error-prone repair protein ImuA [Bacteroidota bacterium]